ncbi:MAG: hypothetical protein JXB00_08720 [Bacteroidales bacterium]|nr:hypothetical protein [Bacteroidales bacterium]
MLKRIGYIPYYLIKTDWRKFIRFMNFAVTDGGKGRVSQMFDCIRSARYYNISPIDYYYFRFYKLNKEQRAEYAGTGFMYEFQKLMNPVPDRRILEDKILFLEHFNDLIHRKYFAINQLIKYPDYLKQLYRTPNDKIVLKNSMGQVGAQVEIFSVSGKIFNNIIKYMKRMHYDLAEEYVVQHSKLMQLSPSGLNTVRIITQKQRDGIEILAARLRISVNSSVDNMAAGNLAAPLDIKSGTIIGPAVYSDITKNSCSVHPVSGVRLLGFSVPYWNEIIILALQAARQSGKNRSIGWDIAVTEKGPELIEGNHNWCKLLWQLPVMKGLKNDLKKYV